jgi:hypothetical protein
MKKWSEAEPVMKRLIARVTEMTTLDPAFQARAWERAALVLRQVGNGVMADLAQQRFEELTVRKPKKDEA